MQKAVGNITFKIRNLNLKKSHQSIDSLNVQWQGSDYAQLQNEWRQMNASDSTSARMIKSLDNYADFLRFSANKYKSAQANAINTAGRLPRY